MQQGQHILILGVLSNIYVYLLVPDLTLYGIADGVGVLDSKPLQLNGMVIRVTRLGGHCNQRGATGAVSCLGGHCDR